MDRIRPSQQSRDFCLSSLARWCLKATQPTGCHTHSQPYPHLTTLTGGLDLCSSYSSCKTADETGMDIFIARGKRLLLQKAEYLPYIWELLKPFSPSQEHCKSSQLINIANIFEQVHWNGDYLYSKWITERLAILSLEHILWCNGFWQAMWKNAKLKKAIIYGSSQMWVSVAAICSFLFSTQPPLIMLFFMS